MKIFYTLAILVLPTLYAKLIAAFICILAILRNSGAPHLTRDYALKVLPSEFTSNLIYLIVTSIGPNHGSILFHFPLMIHFTIGIAEFVFRTKFPGPLYAHPKV